MSSGAAAAETTLTSRDTIRLYEALLPAQNKYYRLGMVLGLDSEDVESIRLANMNSEDSLMRVIVMFLEQAEPTWRDIIEALRRPSVKLTRLARSLEKSHYPDPPQPFISSTRRAAGIILS